jgi:7-carboxy-7-deazaguanine synthase
VTQKKLKISEWFASIQGEGLSAGQLSIFLRLSGCNLLCGCPQGTWVCDTIEVWKKGTLYSASEAVAHFESCGWLSKLGSEGYRLIITGGEPLLQQDGLVEFLACLSKELGRCPIIEIETNGTIAPIKSLIPYISQYNVSPKLINSGMQKEKRYTRDVLTWFAGLPYPQAIFKFVVSSEGDCHEIMDHYVKPLGLKPWQVFIMPGADNKHDLDARLPSTAQWALTYGFNLSSRLHLSIWDKKTGV